jgi:DNA-binding NtrC family response regulator
LPDFENGTGAARTYARSSGSAVSRSLGMVGRTLADVERDLILETLAHCGGNRTHAAGILGISIRTLRNKLKEYARAGHPVPRHSHAARDERRVGLPRCG